MKRNGKQPTAAEIWNQKNFPSQPAPSKKPKLAASSGAELSRQLRLASTDFLTQRRGIVVASLVAIGAMGLISLYQMGVVRHLPEPPLPRLDADRVDASPAAYHRLSTPDAVLGVCNWAATMALAEMGGQARARRQPWIPLALAGKVAFDVAQVVRMVRAQWATNKAFCFWSLLTGAATLASAALALGETREAVRSALKKSLPQGSPLQ